MRLLHLVSVHPVFTAALPQILLPSQRLRMPRGRGVFSGATWGRGRCAPWVSVGSPWPHHAPWASNPQPSGARTVLQPAEPHRTGYFSFDTNWLRKRYFVRKNQAPGSTRVLSKGTKRSTLCACVYGMSAPVCRVCRCVARTPICGACVLTRTCMPGCATPARGLFTGVRVWGTRVCVFEGSERKNQRMGACVLECTLPGRTNKETFQGF